MKYLTGFIAVVTWLTLVPLALAQFPPPTDDVKDVFPEQKHYSPYAGRSFPTQVFWGDTHTAYRQYALVHTVTGKDAAS